MTIAIKAIENGEHGIAPWRKPWFQAGIPMNLESKKLMKSLGNSLSEKGIGKTVIQETIKPTNPLIDGSEKL